MLKRNLNPNNSRRLKFTNNSQHRNQTTQQASSTSFVLRVMAARSPSVGLRRALHSRSKLECPCTVPAKSSKSRVTKLAMISSISQKMGEAKVKVKHVPKQSSTTPDVKAAKKGISNLGTFQSFSNPKPTIIEVPKDRLVAKALVFHSPKKVVKLKRSVELSNSRKICKEMKKLEVIDRNKTNNKRFGSDAGCYSETSIFDCYWDLDFF